DIEYVDPTNALGLDQGNMFALGGLFDDLPTGNAMTIDPRIARARKRAQEGGRVYREVVRDNTNTRRTHPQGQNKLSGDQRAKLKNELNQRVRERRRQDLRERQGEITEYTPQSFRDRAIEIAINPMTAAGYLARGQEIPENFSKGPRNAYDDLTG